jgi:hypothetical protein
MIRAMFSNEIESANYFETISMLMEEKIERLSIDDLS